MTTIEGQAAAEQRRTRWLRLTPDRSVIALLVVEGFLLLSDGFHWFPKGYAVLIAMASVVAAILFMLLWFADSLLYRRRFQFSILSLLLFQVAVAIPCSWLTNEIRWANAQRKVLAEIDTKYGKYSFPVGSYSYPVEKLDWPTYWPRRLLGDDFFVTVDYVLLSRHATDTLIEDLQGLRQLKELHLQETQITDDGLDRLKKSAQLQELYIWDDSSVTDVGIAHLKGLTQLRHLQLECTQVGDVGLEHLMGLKSLRELRLYNTKVTEAGVKNLRHALPDCKISFYPKVDK